jgi:hypothetical protein
MNDEADALAVWESEGGACVEREMPDRAARLLLIRRAVQARCRDFLHGPWSRLAALGAGLVIGGLLGRARAR